MTSSIAFPRHSEYLLTDSLTPIFIVLLMYFQNSKQVEVGIFIG